MESAWISFLRENAPELYEQMLADTKWDIEWRDKKIEKLENSLKRLRVWLPSIVRNTPHSCLTDDHCDALHAAHNAAAEAVEQAVQSVIDQA